MELTLIDQTRQRTIPVCIYAPTNAADATKLVIFSPGYQSQSELEAGCKPGYNNYTYLADFFKSKGLGFSAIKTVI